MVERDIRAVHNRQGIIQTPQNVNYWYSWRGYADLFDINSVL